MVRSLREMRILNVFKTIIPFLINVMKNKKSTSGDYTN